MCVFFGKNACPFRHTYGQSADKQLLVHVESALDGVVCVAGFSALLVPRIGLNVLTITV